MKDDVVAILGSLLFTAALYAPLKLIAPADAAPLATGAFVLSPFLLERIKRYRIEKRPTSALIRAGWSPITGAIIGSLSIIGANNILAIPINAAVIAVFAKYIPVPTLTYVMAFSHFFPSVILFFILGRFVLDIRSHRILVATLIPLPHAFLEAIVGYFFTEWFDSRYLGNLTQNDRQFIYSIKFFVQFFMVAIPFWLGAVFFSLKRGSTVRANVTAMMRLLPPALQEDIRLLVQQEYEQAQQRQP